MSSPQARAAGTNNGGNAHPDRTQELFHLAEFTDAFDDFIKLSVRRLHDPIVSASNPYFAEDAAEFGPDIINRLDVRALVDDRLHLGQARAESLDRSPDLLDHWPYTGDEFGHHWDSFAGQTLETFPKTDCVAQAVNAFDPLVGLPVRSPADFAHIIPDPHDLRQIRTSVWIPVWHSFLLINWKYLLVN
jgi:hypothetical protein